MKNTFDIIEDYVERLLKDFDKVEAVLADELQKYILKMNIQNGRFADNGTALQILAQIKAKAASILSSSGYSKNIAGYLDGFDELSENIKKIQRTVNGVNVPDSLVSDLKRGAAEQALQQLKTTQIEAQFMEPVRKALFARVVTGASVDDTIKTINTMVIGNDERKGVLSRWTGQVARDALGQYQGALNTKIRQKYDFAGYLYVGTLVDDSRSQCARWLGKEFIPIEELAKEIAWAKSNGSGMVSTTTVDTFAIYRGGYNCRHEAIPADGPLEEDKPVSKPKSKSDDDIYKPSGSESFIHPSKRVKLPPIEKDLDKVDKDTLFVLNELERLGVKSQPLVEGGFKGKQYDALIEGKLFEVKKSSSINSFKRRFRDSFHEFEGDVKNDPSKNIFKAKDRSLIHLGFDTTYEELAKSLNGQMIVWKREGVQKLIKEVWIVKGDEVLKIDGVKMNNYKQILNQIKKPTN